MRRATAANRVVVVGAVWATAVSLLLLTLPVYRGMTHSVRIDADGVQRAVVVPTQATLLERNGAGAAVALMLPIVLAAGPLLLRGRRAWRVVLIASTPLLGLFVVLGGFSIGPFYAPSMIALALATLLAWRPRRRDAARGLKD